MGTGETPARVRAVLLPPRPVPRVAPAAVQAADRTLLRSREEGSKEERLREEGSKEHGIESVVSALADSDEVVLVGEREPLVAPALAAALSCTAPETPSALPEVAPKPGTSLPRHLIECRVSVIPRL